MYVPFFLEVDFFPFFFEKHFFKCSPNLRCDPVEGDVGTNVVVKVLVIILDIRLEAIFRKSAVS